MSGDRGKKKVDLFLDAGFFFPHFSYFSFEQDCQGDEAEKKVSQQKAKSGCISGCFFLGFLLVAFLD